MTTAPESRSQGVCWSLMLYDYVEGNLLECTPVSLIYHLYKYVNTDYVVFVNYNNLSKCQMASKKLFWVKWQAQRLFKQAVHVSLFLSPQHTSLSASRSEKGTGWSSRSLGARCRNSIALCSDEQPHIGNYRLLKTIGKGNFAKVKLARHILTGREVSSNTLGLMRLKGKKLK